MPPIITTREEHQLNRLIGLRVAELRLAAGVGQSDLAAAAGFKVEWLESLERGVGPVSAAKLFMIAQTLDVPFYEFFKGLDQLSETIEQLSCTLGLSRD